jgi:disulfide bond formation protein DsbB
MLNLDFRNSALAIGLVLLATILGAWLFQWAGYAPCHLCLQQRWAYYVGIPLAVAVWLLAPVNSTVSRVGLGVLGLLLVASAVFGAYHAGVEWKFWPGPGTCTGELSGGLPTLTNERVVGCDEAALRIPPGFGLSLAGWNAVISAALAFLAFSGLRKR